jgi:hypothetical protein
MDDTRTCRPCTSTARAPARSPGPRSHRCERRHARLADHPERHQCPGPPRRRNPRPHQAAGPDTSVQNRPIWAARRGGAGQDQPTPNRSGSMRLHEKVAQQLPLRRKHTDRIMEDYAFLCIYASRRNALNSADEHVRVAVPLVGPAWVSTGPREVRPSPGPSRRRRGAGRA